MTLRAFLSSKSNTAAGAIEMKKARQNSWQIAPKSEDISVDSGAIFPSRLGQDLSRNVRVVSVYALYKKLYGSIDFFMTPKCRDFHEISTFLELVRECPMNRLGCL